MLTLHDAFDVRYLSQNLTLQELFAGYDEQVAVTCQVSSTILRRIVSYLFSFKSLCVNFHLSFGLLICYDCT